MAFGLLVNFLFLANFKALNVNKVFEECSPSLLGSLVLKFTEFNWSFIG